METNLNSWYYGDIYISQERKSYRKYKKDSGMACHTPPLQKKNKDLRGNAITQPQSHPI